jgi:hypothetical protein
MHDPEMAHPSHLPAYAIQFSMSILWANSNCQTTGES